MGRRCPKRVSGGLQFLTHTKKKEKNELKERKPKRKQPKNKQKENIIKVRKNKEYLFLLAPSGAHMCCERACVGRRRAGEIG